VPPALADPDFRKLMGIVEVDETFGGCKDRSRHADKRTDGPGRQGKTAVTDAVQRGGTVVRAVDLLTATRFANKAISNQGRSSRPMSPTSTIASASVASISSSVSQPRRIWR
jgi:hypothetical protein